MKDIQVEIKGTTPILMNSPKSMIEDMTKTSRKTTQKHIPEEEAERVAYRMKSGELYIPAEAIKGTMVGGASYKKFGKFAAKPFIAAGVIITPTEVGLGTKDYDIDLRTVVIQRNRVVKARPKIENWKVKFTISYDETMITNHEDIRAILEEAGKRVGLLDFRPQKLGNFGMFEVTKWKE